VVADGRQVLEALVQAPVLALAAGDGRDVRAGGVVVAVPRARLEAHPVVHVLVVHRTRRRGEEERGDSQDDDAERAARRFAAARHRSLATTLARWSLSRSVVQCELIDELN